MLELQEASCLPNVWAMISFAPPISSCTVKAKWWFRNEGNRATLVKKIAATLASAGTPAFLSIRQKLHGDLGMIESRDVMLFISYSGGARQLDLIIPRLEDKSIVAGDDRQNRRHRRAWRQKRCWISP